LDQLMRSTHITAEAQRIIVCVSRPVILYLAPAVNRVVA
jgi:hypothetical protein